MYDDELSTFFSELSKRVKKYIKNGLVPSCRLTEDLSDIAIDLDVDDEDVIDEVIPHLPEYGITAITIDDEHYLAVGTSEEKIKEMFLKVLRENDLDADVLYYLGTEEIVRQYSDIFEILQAVVYFAIEDITVGIRTTTKTHQLLNEALADYHFQLHPEDRERSKGWIDEETKEFLLENSKGGYIPSHINQEAINQLLIDYGDYPLCHNIVMRTNEALNLLGLVTLADNWIAPASDQGIIEDYIKKLMLACNVDFDQCYTRGTEAIDNDVLTIIGHHYFFANTRVESLHAAYLESSQLFVKIINDEHELRFPDDEAIKGEIDEKLLAELKVYAKSGYAPSWVTVKAFNRMVKESGSMAIAANNRDATLRVLSLTVLMIDEELYQPIGTSSSVVERAVAERIRKWDLNRAYEIAAVPDINSGEHNQLVAMIFFADELIEDLQKANEKFMDILIAEMCLNRERNHPNEIPISVIQTVEDLCWRYAKKGKLPSAVRDEAVEKISEHVAYDWYADHLYSSLLERIGLEELYFDGEDYIPPMSSREEARRLLRVFIEKLELDYDYYKNNGMLNGEDLFASYYARNILFFADPSVSTVEEAYQGCMEEIDYMSR